MRIGIFGGSFDPIHSAHLDIAEQVIGELHLDKLIIMVAGISPNKPASEAAPAEMRLEMARIAAGSIPGLEVCDWETVREGVTYFADTLDSLEAEYPGAEFFLIIGSDKVSGLRDWYRFEDIAARVKIAVVCRKGSDKADLTEEQAEGLQFLPISARDISSTEIRRRLAAGRPITGMVPQDVEDYIYEQGIYFPRDIREIQQKCKAALTPDRYSHVCRVMEQAADYAERFGVNPEKARLAALLHDCAKCMDKEEQFALSGEQEYIPAILHAPAGAVLAETEYGITDPEILQAIRLHCTGDEGMSDLDMLIFLADMTEHGRSFPSVNEIRDAVWQSLEHGMLVALIYEDRYLKQKNAAIHPAAGRAIRYFQRKESAL
ncbi:MAG: nicotinate-nucleotide adenylyltransferase [Clostridia bacterium]|nr:nicotinate-nucleotide adenylyltransferase [Clostridia bacterium]